MDIYEVNAKAWDEEVRRHNFWTLPASEQDVEKARNGEPELWVTPFRRLPENWFRPLKGSKVLNLCGGGGQQTPVLAAFGCDVTTIDNSSAQLEQDSLVLAKHGLEATLVKGNVLDLVMEDHCFDNAIMPQALNFIDDVPKLYDLVRRLLKDGGHFIFGVANPILYTFDEKVQDRSLRIKYTIPFSDTVSLSGKELRRRLSRKDTIEFSHTLDSILGDLLRNGFIIDGFYTDDSGSELTDSFVHDSHLAIKARAV